MLDSTTEAQRREISGPQRGSVEPDQTPRFCCWCLEELHNVACPRDSVRHPAPCPVYCVSLRLGNCHVITRSCSKAVYTEGGRETFFHWRHHTQHPFLLLCLAITKSCSCDHMRSPPPTIHRPASGAPTRESKSLLPPYTWGHLLSLGFGGSYFPFAHQRSFPEHVETSLSWNGMYQ